MRLNKISAYIGAGLVAASCTMKKPASEKAMEHAAKYLTGIELCVAENNAGKISVSEVMNYSNDIFYWDSLLSVKKENEYKQLGKKHIQDSLDGRYRRRSFYNLKVKPRIDQDGKQICDSIKKEVAKYCTGKEYLKLKKNAPNNSYGNKWGTSDNLVTHYFGELAIRGAERKGFEEGVKEARGLLNKNKQKK